MDDDVFLPTGRGNQQQQQDFLYTDTVGIFVESEWGSNTLSGVQLCPAVYVPTAYQIPRAVKHIYSRLAATASKLDQGVPELLLSLVGTGNSFSFENSDRLVRGLGHLISRCGLWVVSSGEQNDPLAVATSTALRSTFSGQSDVDEETLSIVVHCSDVRHVGATTSAGHPNPPVMADARLNTFFLLWARSEPSDQQLLLFRACTAVKLANPPPALLIGVPEERSSTGLGPFFSMAQTPIGGGPSNSPAILLPSGPSTAERKPLPLVLFCGATLPSLLELLVYVQCGVPALVVQDISELCVMLKAAFSLLQSAGFEHTVFERWLDRELRMVSLATTGHFVDRQITEAKSWVFQLLLTVSSTEHSLLAFMPAQKLNRLGEQALDLLVRSAPDTTEMGRALELAIKVGTARTVNSIRLEGLLAQEQVSDLILTALTAADDRLDVLTALLDQNIPLKIDSDFLIRWAANIKDPYFFNAIILGHLMGLQSGRLCQIDLQIAKQFGQLMDQLSGGVSQQLFPTDLFAPAAVSSSSSSHLLLLDPERNLRLLAVWALLLHRPQLVRLFCSYSPEPMALCLVLAKSARTLARWSRAWIFYEHSLQHLARQLAQTAVKLLDTAYQEDANKAYNALCRPLPTFRQLTLTQLAYETNSREFIDHPCCQRWVLRLLFGRIHIRCLWRHFCLPNWLKILLCALLVWPIAFWIRPRSDDSQQQHVGSTKTGRGELRSRPMSPTCALLEDGRQQKRVRSSSANSMHSMRSAGGPFGGPDPRRNSAMFPLGEAVNLANGAAAGIDGDDLQQAMGTNDDSTLTDSFLPSASQMRGVGPEESRNKRAAELEAQRRREQQQRGSRRQSPDRRSLMFYDGASGGGGSHRKLQSRANSGRMMALNSRDGLGPINLLGGSATSRLSGNGFCPASLFLFYSTPIAKYWLHLAFRIFYLLSLGAAVAQPGCFLSGWREQLLWLWTLCWLLDSLWVFVCKAQLTALFWHQHRWALFDLAISAGFLLSLLAMRISTSTGILLVGSAFELRAVWALFLLWECHKTLFLFAPYSPVLGPMLVRIRLMLTRDLVNFTLLLLPLLAASAVAIKATLYPDLSAQPTVMAESFGWSFRQLFTTDLDVLSQSGECQRQLLPERRPLCQGLGGYANPRCPSQHWLASLTLWEYLVFLKLLCWPILFALFARTARRVEEEAQQLWRFQLYGLATDFSLRPCLPPPLTPLFLLLLACCRLSCLQQSFGGHRLATDHPDLGSGPPRGGQSKFNTVYRNPSVLIARGRPLCGYWRRLAVGLWKAEQRSKSDVVESGGDAQPSQDKASLLMGFHALHQQMDRPRTTMEEEEEAPEDVSTSADGGRKEAALPKRLKVNKLCRDWLHLLPDYRPNHFSLLTDQFPAEVQKHVEECSPQGLLDLANQWRQNRLMEFVAWAEDPQQRGGVATAGIQLSGNGLPLNPRGRTGLAGRGNFARFGPNRMLLYALFRRQTAGNSNVQVLVQNPSGRLPSRWAHTPGRPMVDEFMAQLLLQLGLPDPEIHAFSTKTGLASGQRDGPVAMVGELDDVLKLLAEERHREWPEETDNAWAEGRLWAVELSGCSQLHQLAQGGDLAWTGLDKLGQAERRLVQKALALFENDEKDMDK